MSTVSSIRARRCSLLTTLLLAAQAAGGLLIPGLYRDNAWVSSVFRGQDFVALVFVVPLLMAAHVGARRGSIRWYLVWLGALYKVFYNNLYYLFGSDFNRFFLLYIAIFIASATTVVMALVDLHVEAFNEPPLTSRPATVATFVLFGAAGTLTCLWVGQSLLYVANGQVPQLVTDGGGGTHLVAALDLTAIVPPMLISGWLLRRSHPWGRVLAPAMLVQSTLIVVDLVVTPAFQAAAGIQDAWAMLPVWLILGTGFILGAGLLLGSAPKTPASA